MSRYVRVENRIWADEKVRALSRPQPNAQSLFLYLLTGPHAEGPGCFEAGEYGLAEKLRWPIEGFRVAMQELLDAEMVRVDWDAQVVWVVNTLKHDPPANGNVLKHWLELLETVPECALKTAYVATLEPFLARFGLVPDNGSANPLPNDSANPSRNGRANPEPLPEPLPEPRVNTPPTPSAGGTAAKPPRVRVAQPPDEGFEDFYGPYPRHDDRQDAVRAWNALTHAERERAVMALPRWKSSEQWQTPRYVPMAATFLNKRRFDDEPPPRASPTGQANGRASPVTFEAQKQANTDEAFAQVRSVVEEGNRHGISRVRGTDAPPRRILPG